MEMIPLEGFRHKRDRFALDGYYQRWPTLYKQQRQLKQDIAVLQHRMGEVAKAPQHMKDEMKALGWKFQNVTGELASIKLDFRNRATNLGLRVYTVPVPQTYAPKAAALFDAIEAPVEAAKLI